MFLHEVIEKGYISCKHETVHEIVEKIKSANSADEVLVIAKECNVEITREEANKYFHQLHLGELDDDLLVNVSGGCDHSSDDGDYEDKNQWLIFF